MGLRIQNNVEAFNTHRQLSATSTAASKAMEKLSSGYRINRAADDAAGLADAVNRFFAADDRETMTAGAARAAKRYSWEEFARLLSGVLSSRARPPLTS